MTAAPEPCASRLGDLRDRAAAALRRCTAADVLCLGGIVVSLAIGYAALPLVPLLLRHVVVHLLVTGSISALLTAGAAAEAGHLSLWLAAAAGVVGNAAFDGFYFWAGRRYGTAITRAASWTGVPPRAVARLEDRVRRHGGIVVALGPFLPVPAVLILLVAGASEVRWRTFVVCDALGWYAWCVLVAGLGWAFHGQVDEVSAAITRWSLLSVGVAVVLLVAGIAWQHRARRRREVRA